MRHGFLRSSLGLLLPALGVLSACGGGQAAPAASPASVGSAEATAGTSEMPADEPVSLEPSPAAAGIEPAEGPLSGVTRFRVPADEGPSRGSPAPLVTVVEFSDYECPFCSRAEPTVDRLVATYPNEVRVVYRHHPLPMHTNAKPAAHAAIEVFEQGGDEAFWQYHERLFENQDRLSPADLERYATELPGIDAKAVRDAVDREAHADVIERDSELAERIGARGTPAFFINGRKLMGAQPWPRFEEMVREEIANARRLLEEGLDRDDIYVHHIADAARTTEAAEPSAPEPPRRRRPDPDAIYAVPVDDQPTRGPDAALVTIVEFADFQCPFCARVEPTLDALVDEYGRDLRIVWRNNPLPFHDEARPAAIAAMEVYRQGGDDKFWEYHDLLLENQRELTRDKLEDLAREVGGINIRAFRRALERERHEDVIEQDQELAQSLGASGTPAFFINGRMLRGAQPLPAFKEVIGEELERARALVREGTPRRRVYEKAIEGGATEPQYIGGDEAEQEAEPSEPSRYAIDVPSDAPQRGDEDAPLTMQIFSDFQCPFCSRAVPTVERVLEEYEGKVQVVFRHYPLPFHENAMPAAQAAVEVHSQKGDEAFWRYHDLLFENQRDLTRATLERLAKKVGVRMGPFRRALDRREHEDRVREDMKAVKDAGMRIGTPSFLIGGRLVQGAQPFDAFERAIDAELAERDAE